MLLSVSKITPGHSVNVTQEESYLQFLNVKIVLWHDLQWHKLIACSNIDVHQEILQGI